MYIYGHLILYCVLRLQRKSPVCKIVVHRHPYDIGNFVDIIDIVVNITRKCKAGERGGQGGQNTWGPECSEGPGNLGKMFVSCLSSAISRGTGARVHKSSFCPGACHWLSPALRKCTDDVAVIYLLKSILKDLFYTEMWNCNEIEIF